MALTGTQYVITGGAYRATIVEVGAGLRELTHDGVELVAGYGADDLPPKGAGATLVPWPNRLRDGRYSFAGKSYQLPITEVALNNANHGLARWTRWELREHTEESVTLSCDIVPQSGWPFEITAVVTYTLGVDGLTVRASATNDGETAAPFGIGFHPYLSVHGAAISEISLQIPADSYLTTDPHQIPVSAVPVDATSYDFRESTPLGVTRLDDAFTGLIRAEGRAVTVLTTPTASTRLWCEESFGYLQVFTADPWNGGRPAVAVEPMSCPADAFNSGDGLVVLGPGEKWQGTWGIDRVV